MNSGPKSNPSSPEGFERLSLDDMRRLFQACQTNGISPRRLADLVERDAATIQWAIQRLALHDEHSGVHRSMEQVRGEVIPEMVDPSVPKLLELKELVGTKGVHIDQFGQRPQIQTPLTHEDLRRLAQQDYIEKGSLDKVSSITACSKYAAVITSDSVQVEVSLTDVGNLIATFR